MNNYRRIGADIEALQWNPQIKLNGITQEGLHYFYDNGSIRYPIHPNDWIVTSNGKTFVMKDHAFRQMYTLIAASAPGDECNGAPDGYHCWHPSSSDLTEDPPIYICLCCWCNKQRLLIDPGEGIHGDHLPKFHVVRS
jgi:hypothetical protein